MAELVQHTYDDDRKVVEVYLNRSDKRNALSQELLQQLNDAYRHYGRDMDVKAIILRAHGPSFCAGMDLTELGSLVAKWETNQIPWSDGGLLIDVIRTIRQHPAITIAAVHGYCGGGGLALATAHDIVIAAETTKFILPETQRGSFGALAAAAVHYWLPTKVAFDMQLTGRELTGSEAASYGFVSRAVPEKGLDAAVESVLDEIAARTQTALTHAKMGAYTSERMTFDEALMHDLLIGARQNRTAQSFQDVQSFLASRSTRPNLEAR